MALSIAEQHRRIREDYPNFTLVCDLGFMGVWEGPLTPVFKTYKIRITYVPFRYFENFWLGNPTECIVVLDPPIGRDPRGIGESAQHIYGLNRHPDFPRLCVHDPVANDWDADQYIADTLIPFTIDWLFWHEDWVATGIWRGRGRHPEVPPHSSSDDSAAISRAVAQPFPTAAFMRLGALAGTCACETAPKHDPRLIATN